MSKSPNKDMFSIYASDGRVKDVEETESKPDAEVKFKRLSFTFFDKYQPALSRVTFETDSFHVDLYYSALRFIKSLDYKPN